MRSLLISEGVGDGSALGRSSPSSPDMELAVEDSLSCPSGLVKHSSNVQAMPSP